VYSLEVRVSLDEVDREKNDGVRGPGSWALALQAIRLLDARGLLPIVTATEILGAPGPGASVYERFRDFLQAAGFERPRVKVMPVFRAGRLAGGSSELVTAGMLEGFDTALLQCSGARVVAHGGVYACPILAGLPGARLSDGDLEASFRPAPLYHPACVTCYQTGMSCRNF
jgi:hypothetical protein